MIKTSKLFLLLLLLGIFACKKESPNDVLQQAITSYQTYRKYDFNRTESVANTIKYYQKEADFAAALKEKIAKIDGTKLSETDRISLELLRFVLQNKIDTNTFQMYLNPITSESAFHLNLANMANLKITNYKQAKSYLKQLNNLPKRVDYNLALLRAGVKAGISQPKAVFDDYEFTYNKHIVSDYKTSEFYKPFNHLPSNLTSQQKDSVLAAAKVCVENDVVAQYKKIKDFFENEYFPNTRKGLGVTTTPNGKAFYQNRINFYTTSTQYTAESIHELGLKEVARIRAKMQKIIDYLGFKGSFADFLHFLRTDPQFYPKTGRELLMRARDIAKRIDGQLPKYFKTLPRRTYGVTPVPAAIAPKYTGGRYSPARNDKSSGSYWVNTYNLPSRTLYTLPALTAHEAVPGHHLQMSLNSELSKSIPRFRRNLYLSAYGEGWGLYSEYLADEMGIYTTPYEKFGQLTYEMWRACRLVVDTGVHAMGWTRQQVLDYLSENTALSIHEITTETDRYISWPGQALSYKIGELKIRELRKRAEDELKNKFDIRDFHEVILGEGTVTLAIMERRVNSYIARVKKEKNSL